MDNDSNLSSEEDRGILVGTESDIGAIMEDSLDEGASSSNNSIFEPDRGIAVLAHVEVPDDSLSSNSDNDWPEEMDETKRRMAILARKADSEAPTFSYNLEKIPMTRQRNRVNVGAGSSRSGPNVRANSMPRRVTRLLGQKEMLKSSIVHKDFFCKFEDICDLDDLL